MKLKLPPIAAPLLLLLPLQKNAVAGPLALPLTVPEPAPAPEALSLSIVAPEAVLPEPEPALRPDPEPAVVARAADEASPNEHLNPRQTYNYYPFSGAIYIVGSGGSTITSASAAQCPAEAPQSCGNINVYNWCCPLGNTCSWLSDSVVGCCPGGSTCGGNVAEYEIQTVTVTQYLTAASTSTYQQAGSTVIEVGGQTSTTTVQGIYVTVIGTATGTTTAGGIYVTVEGTATTPATAAGIYVTEMGTTTTTTQTSFNHVVTTTPSHNQIIGNGQYCSTLVANGPDLPTTREGACGTILVISKADVRSVGWRLPVLITGFYGVLGLYSLFGFKRRL